MPRTYEGSHQSLWQPRRSADGLSCQRQPQLARETAKDQSDATIWGAGCTSIEKIKVLIDGGIIETTPGRVIFNTIVPKQLGFQNYVLRKKRLSELVLECYKKIGLETTVRFLDKMKNLGFAEATKAAISMGTSDVKVPSHKKQMLRRSRQTGRYCEETVRRRDHHGRGAPFEDHQYLDRSFR